MNKMRKSLFNAVLSDTEPPQLKSNKDDDDCIHTRKFQSKECIMLGLSAIIKREYTHTRICFLNRVHTL